MAGVFHELRFHELWSRRAGSTSQDPQTGGFHKLGFPKLGGSTSWGSTAMVPQARFHKLGSTGMVPQARFHKPGSTGWWVSQAGFSQAGGFHELGFHNLCFHRPGSTGQVPEDGELEFHRPGSTPQARAPQARARWRDGGERGGRQGGVVGGVGWWGEGSVFNDCSLNHSFRVRRAYYQPPQTRLDPKPDFVHVGGGVSTS